MNGVLKKICDSWYVELNDYGIEVKLHPNDVSKINKLSENFDNIEARILSEPNVEVVLEVIKTEDSHIQYAKLKTDSNRVSEQTLVPNGGVPWGVNALNWFVVELKKLNESYPQFFKSGFNTFEYNVKLDELIKKAKELNDFNKD